MKKPIDFKELTGKMSQTWSSQTELFPGVQAPPKYRRIIACGHKRERINKFDLIKTNYRGGEIDAQIPLQ